MGILRICFNKTIKCFVLLVACAQSYFNNECFADCMPQGCNEDVGLTCKYYDLLKTGYEIIKEVATKGVITIKSKSMASGKTIATQMLKLIYNAEIFYYGLNSAPCSRGIGSVIIENNAPHPINIFEEFQMVLKELDTVSQGIFYNYKLILEKIRESSNEQDLPEMLQAKFGCSSSRQKNCIETYKKIFDMLKEWAKGDILIISTLEHEHDASFANPFNEFFTLLKSFNENACHDIDFTISAMCECCNASTASHAMLLLQTNSSVLSLLPSSDQKVRRVSCYCNLCEECRKILESGYENCNQNDKISKKVQQLVESKLVQKKEQQPDTLYLKTDIVVKSQDIGQKTNIIVQQQSIEQLYNFLVVLFDICKCFYCSAENKVTLCENDKLVSNKYITYQIMKNIMNVFIAIYEQNTKQSVPLRSAVLKSNVPIVLEVISRLTGQKKNVDEFQDKLNIDEKEDKCHGWKEIEEIIKSINVKEGKIGLCDEESVGNDGHDGHVHVSA